MALVCDAVLIERSLNGLQASGIFEGIDFVHVLQRQGDVIESFEKALASIVIDFERCRETHRRR